MAEKKKPNKSANPAKKAPKRARKQARKPASKAKTARRGSSTPAARKKPSGPDRNRPRRQNDGQAKNRADRPEAKTQPPASRDLTGKEQELVKLLRRIQAGQVVAIEQADLDRLAQVSFLVGAIAGLAGGLYLAKILTAE